MIRALIIEDELPAAKRLGKLISKISDDIIIEATTDSIESSVKWLRDNKHPDLIFLDIQLADGLCFEIFKKVTIDSFIIFTTAYDEYAIKAFELNSIDYLLKPVNEIYLAKAIEKYRSMKSRFQFNVKELIHIIENRKPAFKSRFIIYVGDKIRTVNTVNIAYFYSMGKNTFLSTGEGKEYPVDFSLEKLESLVDPELFFRINRQYLVNFDAIANIVVFSRSRIKLELIPSAGNEVFVSNARAHEFRKWLDR